MNSQLPIGERPPAGKVPSTMLAWTVRPERYGEPTKSFAVETVPVPEVGDDEVLVYVMAAGVNYNNIWAGRGDPVDVIGARRKAGEKEDFHIGGSDASGVVYRVGRNVKDVAVGDEVVVHCGQWDADCPRVREGVDPMYSPSYRIWGYESNWGSFAQFTKVQAQQCLPKPRHLTWEAAASYMLVGATAYRMLRGWPEHSIRPGDVVLVWGGSGGLGCMAIQVARAMGATPVAVVSSEERGRFCMELGAKGFIDRRRFDHWGLLPDFRDTEGYARWLEGARAFGRAIWDVVGERKNPRVVFEHPGEATLPTSVFVCDTGGMVTICAGSTGFNATLDLRYLWMRQKRVQGSHFANGEQARGLHQLVMEGRVDPCLGQTYAWDELAEVHDMMANNRHPSGNLAVLVGAPRAGLGAVGAASSRKLMQRCTLGASTF